MRLVLPLAHRAAHRSRYDADGAPVMPSSLVRSLFVTWVALVLCAAHTAYGAATRAETIEGRWRLLAAEDLRADGTVARHPWGQHPVGAIVVQEGACYVQIMSSDTPAFTGPTAVTEQMARTLLSSYIAYSGPCVVNEAEGKVTLKVQAAWRPDYVGTEQVRFFRFADGKMFFGPAANSIKTDGGLLTRRLTLERVR